MSDLGLDKFINYKENIGLDNIVCIDANNGNYVIPDAVDRGVPVQITPELCVYVFNVDEQTQLTRESVLRLIQPHWMRALEERYHIRFAVSNESGMQALDCHKQEKTEVQLENQPNRDLLLKESIKAEVIPSQDPKFATISELQEYIFGNEESKKKIRSVNLPKQDRKRIMGLLKKLEKAFESAHFERKMFLIQSYREVYSDLVFKYRTSVCDNRQIYKFNRAYAYLKECEEKLAEDINGFIRQSAILQEIIAIGNISTVVTDTNQPVNLHLVCEDIESFIKGISDEILDEQAIQEVDKFLKEDPSVPNKHSANNTSNTDVRSLVEQKSTNIIPLIRPSDIENITVEAEKKKYLERCKKAKSLVSDEMMTKYVLMDLSRQGNLPPSVEQDITDNRELIKACALLRSAEYFDADKINKFAIDHPFLTAFVPVDIFVSTGIVLPAILHPLLFSSLSYEEVSLFFIKNISVPLTLIFLFGICKSIFFKVKKRYKGRNVKEKWTQYFVNLEKFTQMKNEISLKLKKLEEIYKALSENQGTIFIRHEVHNKMDDATRILTDRISELRLTLEQYTTQIDICHAQIEENFMIYCCSKALQLPAGELEEKNISTISAELNKLFLEIDQIEKELHNQEIGDKVKKELQS